MDKIKCPCGLRNYMEEEDCKKISCNACCPLTKPQTNADRIRGMSDEKLADMLWKTGRNYRVVCADPVVDYNEHRDNLIAWLKQPPKGE